MYGYNYFTDENGKELAVNMNTGEVTDAITITVPVGTTVRTPEQQKAYKEFKAHEAKTFFRRKMMDELGYFYFVLCEHKLGKLSAETAARLIYLCTYLDYNKNFMLTQRQHMKKSDLQEVLGLSTGTTFKFWKEVNPQYIIEDVDGLKLISDDITRGTITDSKKSYQRFYIDAIRKVYLETKPTRHRHLGYVYQVLPFINFEYNIICWNPEEKVLDNIKPLTVAEFCGFIGYNAGDYKKLLKLYRQITFEINNQREYFLTFVMNEADAEHIRIFVNPRIIYSGSDYKKVEVLGAFTKCEC